MSRHTKRFIRRQKSYLAAGVVALAAVIALAGVAYKNNQKEKQQTAQAETTQQTQQAADAGTDEPEDAVAAMSENDAKTKTDASQATANGKETAESTEPTADAATVKNEQDTKKETAKADAAKKKAVTMKLTFADDSKMVWPVEGNILMKYSMDQSVYFATLDEYKYNPALVIQSSVNTKVHAAADCKVEAIATNETTGTTITVDMGNGYKAIYGQLKEVEVKKGDELEQGSILGYIAEPTKYYSVEGANLFFEVTKDEKPVDPMGFLR